MAFKKIETKVVSLGDQPGQVKEVQGKLLEIQKSQKFEGNNNYILETKDGKVTVFGSAYINQRVNSSLIGKMIKFVYVSFNAKSRAKAIDVFVDE